MDLHDAINLIKEAIEYEGSEVGECWMCLVDLYHYNEALSTKFKQSLQQEIIDVAKWIQDNSEVVEEEIDIPAHKKIVKILRFKY